MYRDDESIVRRGAPKTDYYEWWYYTNSDNVSVTKCGGIMNLTDKKKGAFVGTDPDAELNIYIFDQYVKNIIIKKHDRTSGWRAKMGAVHIGQ